MHSIKKLQKRHLFSNVDINECLINNGGCGDVSSTECVNNWGSFSCQCKQGYNETASNCIGKFNLKIVEHTLNFFVQIFCRIIKFN